MNRTESKRHLVPAAKRWARSRGRTFALGRRGVSDRPIWINQY